MCHPDQASDASVWKDLGQPRASEAGSGFDIAQRSFSDEVAQTGVVLIGNDCPK
jgi:hypothetical protein